ncbi:MAG: hypothetical protein LBB62_00165 [Proteiniphilum sp.]|jgi:hypothetical protein|nr:hypothetical protein [Proteiniphilum sp.]
MTRIPDWLQRNHEALGKQASLTYDYISADPQRTRMGFGDDTPLGKWLEDVFQPAFDAFLNVLADWRDPAMRTRALTAALYEAERNFVPLYRELYMGWLKNNPLVTNEDLVFMGLPKHSDGERSPAPVPDTWPAAIVNTATLRRIVIAYSDSLSSHKRAKPAGVHGAEICWTVVEAPQSVRLDELVHSTFDTRTPFVFDFEEEERGRMFYFALRWENTRGAKGPFSPIHNAIIP